MRFRKHIFICTNERNDPNRKSCGEECGMALVKAFKKAIADNNLKGQIRAQRSGCLDACDFGPSMVVYPEGIFYGEVQLSDVDEIVNEHLLNDRPVTRLITDFGKVKNPKE